jgi:hypothetical protein
MSSLPASDLTDDILMPKAKKARVEEEEVYPCFFQDFGYDDDREKVVKLGVTRLNLIFDPEKGPFSCIMNFDTEAPEESMLEKLSPMVEGQENTVVELRKAALDKTIKKWLGKAAKAKIEEVRLIMSSLAAFGRAQTESPHS